MHGIELQEMLCNAADLEERYNRQFIHLSG
jgi:hypothetical protein